MQNTEDRHNAGKTDPCEAKRPDEFVWATSEETRLRALSLYIIRSIVEKHGGTIEIDIKTNTIDIDVPERKRLVCAQEIHEKVALL